MSTSKYPRRPTNVCSMLLNQEENTRIFQLLGNDCYSLATAVVQLLFSAAPDHFTWSHKYTGVVCFTKDYVVRSYFFRLYSLANGKLWEQEFYRDFSYNVVTPTFHSFEADNCMAAFNFSNAVDASNFGNAVINKIEDKKNKMNRRRRRQQKDLHHANSTSTYPSDHFRSAEFKPTISNGHTSVVRRTSATSNLISIKDKYDKKKRLSKRDIGLPITCTFEHRQHIGIDGVRYDENVSVNSDFTEMMRAFQRAYPDLKEYELNEVIDKYGGMERLKQELTADKRRAPPPPPPPKVPVRECRSLNSRSRERLPPPPPVPANNVSKPSFVPPRQAPAPPEHHAPTPPPPSPMNNVPSVPVPPPLPSQSELSSTNTIPKTNKIRSNILAEIVSANTRKLKHVTSNDNTMHEPSNDDSHGFLLDAIKCFDKSTLRAHSQASTTCNSKTPSTAPSSTESSVSMVDQIRDELERRRRLLCHNDRDDENDEGSNSEDEWNDENN